MAAKRESSVSENGSTSVKQTNKKRKIGLDYDNNKDDWSSWGVEEVCEFLRSEQLEEMVSYFVGKKITGNILPYLNDDGLISIGIDTLRERLQVLHAIGKLIKDTASHSTPTFSQIHDQIKVFNDPIHGHVEMHPLCVRIIDTPQFQRLRYIKQLGGCYYVFPGATHNRFEHSIGVAWLAGQLVNAIKRRQPELRITEGDILCVSIAGLCHDLGHGPFSHMFDGSFIPQARPGCDWKHEEASVKMFDYMIESNNLKDVFEDYGLNEQDLTFIKEQIKGPIKNRSAENWPYEGREQHKSFLYEVVANKRNGIDVDKWDYFARDSHQLGINNNFDHTRFMKFARVITVDGEKQICSRDKEVYNLYDMFYARTMLHRRAYQHKTNNIIELMITEALCKADDHIKFEGKGGKLLKISETIDDMVAFVKLNDYIFQQILFSTTPELEPARKVLEMVERRQLYKCVGQTQPKPNYKITDDMIDQIKKKIIETPPTDDEDVVYNKLTPGDLVLQVVKMDYGMKEKNPIDHVRFYMKGNPTIPIQVRSDQVSRMLPQQFQEYLVRLYCKKTDQDSLNVATQCFNRWCSSCEYMTQPKGGDILIGMTPVKSSQETRLEFTTPNNDKADLGRSDTGTRRFHSRLSFN